MFYLWKFCFQNHNTNISTALCILFPDWLGGGAPDTYRIKYNTDISPVIQSPISHEKPVYWCSLTDKIVDLTLQQLHVFYFYIIILELNRFAKIFQKSAVGLVAAINTQYVGNGGLSCRSWAQATLAPTFIKFC